MAHAVAAHLVRALADYKDYTGAASVYCRDSAYTFISQVITKSGKQAAIGTSVVDPGPFGKDPEQLYWIRIEI